MRPTKPGGRPQARKALAPSAFMKAGAQAGLQAQPGKVAIANRYRGSISTQDQTTCFTGSIDMDAAYLQAEPASHRWDYGLGVQVQGKKEFAVWVEPHPASSTGEVKKVLAKLDWLQAKLKQGDFKLLKVLTDECVRQGHTPYHWMASAHVAIRPGSREFNMLSVRGVSLTANRVTI